MGFEIKLDHLVLKVIRYAIFDISIYSKFNRNPIDMGQVSNTTIKKLYISIGVTHSNYLSIKLNA